MNEMMKMVRDASDINKKRKKMRWSAVTFYEFSSIEERRGEALILLQP